MIFVRYLKQYTIDGNGANKDSVITVEGGNLSLSDSNTNGTGQITGGQGHTDGLNLGGGVYIKSGGTFTLNSGVICENHAQDGGGGVYNKGTFAMSGGIIANNTSDYYAGGVRNEGTVIMLGGTISDNKITYGNGGGVYNAGALLLGGKAKIFYNKKGDNANDVYADPDLLITIRSDMPLKSGASIGVITGDYYFEEGPTSVAITGTIDADYSSYFFSDCSDYSVIFKTDHLELGIPSDPVEYKVTSGADGKLTKGSISDYTIKVDAPYDEFTKVLIDNKVVDDDNYTVKSGSTIVTFNKEYLETLSVGKHDVEMVWENGTAKTTLTIKEADDPTDPTTVDPTDPTTVDPTDPTTVDPTDPTTVEPTTADPTVSPATGYSSNINLWIVVLGISASIAAAAFMIIAVRRKKAR